jgi:four helix bundle protein
VEREMIQNYEDLIVWQRADQLACKVFDLSEQFPKSYLYDLTSQLRRAALSVPTNIAEGCASSHTRELLQFINISRRSLSETRYLLGFAFRRGLIKPEQMEEVESLCDETGKMLTSLDKSLRSKKPRGAA